MGEARPNLVVLAGPNGAGKSTTAPALLKGTLGVEEFVNADIIAQGLSAFRPEQVALQAGRILLRRLKKLANRRVNFAFESTLASRTFAPWIARLQATGYAFYLVFLWLPTAAMAQARVKERVRLGGHDIPAATVRRRYQAGLRNFFQLYRPLANGWELFDNSEIAGPRLVTFGERGAVQTIILPETWERVLKES
jgi:predicted ABC-type ATPase